MRALRSGRRLLATVAHLLHGLWIVARRFDAMDAAQRTRAVQWWSGRMLGVLGVALDAPDRVPAGARLLVANHVSWLDILAIHAMCPQARFVSKADVHHWPLVGRLAAGAGTLFIERERKRDALRVVHQTAEAMRDGALVAIFPEGTTGDGHDVLPFHANLFQAAITAQVPVQPLVLRFSQPGHRFSPAVVYIGDTSLLQSLWWVLSAQGVVAHVRVLAERSVGTDADRRSLSEACRADILAGLDSDGGRAASPGA